MSITVKCLPESSRPYERLETYGAQALSDVELIAIILRNGSTGLSSVELASELLALDSRKEGLSFLRDFSLEELRRSKGMGRVKAITIKAALEIGRRSMLQEPFWKNKQITCPQDSKVFFENMMVNLVKEEVHALLLDTRHRVIRHTVISSGGLASTGIFPREIFREAIKANAAAIVIAHNHPSGDPKPSPDDIATTNSLDKSANLLGISLIDHIIIGRGTSSSLKELGFL